MSVESLDRCPRSKPPTEMSFGINPTKNTPTPWINPELNLGLGFVGKIGFEYSATEVLEYSIKALDYFVTGHNTLVSKQYERIIYNSISRRQ